jgi:hypothetical protein
MNWYDDEGAMIDILSTEGLAGLCRIQRERSAAHYARGERLQTWVFVGRFVGDGCGNFGLLDERQATRALSPVVPIAVAESIVGPLGWSLGFGPTLPQPNWTCKRCGEGWTLQNAHDTYGTERMMHVGCRRLEALEQAQSEFHELFARAGIPVKASHLIPDRYWGPSDPFGKPWMIADTSFGPIRIGWRKRVISIDWELPGSKFKVAGDEVVGNDRVTCSAALVHAWGHDKAVEYLQRLWMLASERAAEERDRRSTAAFVTLADAVRLRGKDP